MRMPHLRRDPTPPELRFTVGQRVRRLSGESGRIVNGWATPVDNVWLFERDVDGVTVEAAEVELRPDRN